MSASKHRKRRAFIALARRLTTNRLKLSRSSRRRSSEIKELLMERKKSPSIDAAVDNACSAETFDWNAFDERVKPAAHSTQSEIDAWKKRYSAELLKQNELAER